MDLRDTALAAVAEEVGAEGPVVPVGGGTLWEAAGEGRRVRAPAGVVAYEPAEMTVRVRAGTTVAELGAALVEHRQMVPLDPVDPIRATVGGVLAEGVSGLRRLRWGPVRDTVLEVRYVSAEGRLVKSGGPVVKNVSGFDLCRLMVGSRGTLGVLAEVVLRVHPIPPTSRWFRGDGLDPFDVRRRLHRPSSVLWDGATTWVLLEGHPADVDAQSRLLDVAECDGPPPLPPYRRSLRPRDVRGLTGTFVAEVGVGTVHVPTAPPPVEPDRIDLHRRVKEQFDPTGRLNPGRSL
jgi:FAD/FMN-containing dehydrogenase